MTITSTFREQSGFSLLEILIAMAVMAILSGIMVGRYIDKTEDAGFQRLKGDLAVIESAIFQYHADNFRLQLMSRDYKHWLLNPISHQFQKITLRTAIWSTLRPTPGITNINIATPENSVNLTSIPLDGMVSPEAKD
jgi:prepilin-type N-terminal cleavage/methylation domain-containing protein